MEFLDLIYKEGFQKVGKISAVKYLNMVDDKTTASERKRNSNDPLRKIGGSAICVLRGFVEIFKTSRGRNLKDTEATPTPMPVYVEPRIQGRSSDTSFTKDNLLTNFNGRPPDGARAWKKKRSYILLKT